MTKLLITYRATIDRYVPIAVRSKYGKRATSQEKRFFVVREFLKITT